jgi:flagellar export protein FliJ
VKSLATLIKLHKTRVDEQRVQLARLQARLEEIETKIAALEIEKAREQVAAEKSAEARGTYGAFLKQAVKKGRELEKDRQIAIAAVDAAREVLMQIYEEQKRFEIAEAARIEAEAKESRRRDRIDLDEVGGVGYIRKKTE